MQCFDVFGRAQEQIIMLIYILVDSRGILLGDHVAVNSIQIYGAKPATCSSLRV